MKKYLLMMVIVALGFACTNSNQKTIAEILKNPVVEMEVTTTGEVCHVCHCTAKRCLLRNEKKQCLKVEWKDAAKKFPRRLLNKKIKVSGLLKMKVLTHKRVEEMLAHAMEDKSEIKIIESNRMLKWMKVNNKDSFNSYYIECLSFEEVK